MAEKLKILVDENIPYIRGRLEPLADITYLDQNDFSRENSADADALLIRTRTRCDSRLLAGSKAKLVATATIGTDQIDIPWCEQNGITVRNSPGCNAPGVAQYVWASILRSGHDPKGLKVAVVGCGNVGSIVADWGRKLGAEVMISDPFRHDVDSKPLHEILPVADVVTLHTPLTREGLHPTFHLIGEEELSMMKQGALLVNAARGPVVDFNALKEALKTGRIRAVIDTWEGEPVVDPEVLSLVEIGTFHIAGYSRQGKERATRMVLEAVEDRFGVKVDKTGLTGKYEPLSHITPQMITDSYDPYADDRMLRENPDAFETLRHDYHYREEVKSKAN